MRITKTFTTDSGSTATVHSNGGQNARFLFQHKHKNSYGIADMKTVIDVDFGSWTYATSNAHSFCNALEKAVNDFRKALELAEKGCS